MTARTSPLKVAVLGAGPAGVGAALALSRSGKAQVDVIELSDRVGGAASGFLLEGIHCDLGSHRLHPAAEPEVLGDIKAALGEDLLWRPRHGRIRLKGRWIHFPLKPFDFALNAPPEFVASVALDAATKPFQSKPTAPETFASVLEQGLGRTICRDFYFPYARKLWGAPPESLDPVAAHRRVSGSSIQKVIGKVLRQLPGLKSPTTGGFYYPRRGFGQIVEGLAEVSRGHGAQYHLQCGVEEIRHSPGDPFVLSVRRPEGMIEMEADAVWSSIPISTLVRAMRPAAPGEVAAAAAGIRFRAMILIYLVLEQDQYTEYDAHYFPGIDIPMSRLSEPKNYSAATEPKGVTVLCAELPCDPADAEWAMDDAQLGRAMCDWLELAGLPRPARVKTCITKRLRQAYPIYDRDFAGKLQTMENWVGGVPGLVTFGRQGLFAHDNTHHALAMAYAAEACLSKDGNWDAAGWARAREGFREHVVED